MNHPSVPESIRDMISGMSDAGAASALQILPVVLAGGAGTRLWPLSREAYPKQLLALLGDRSMLEMSVSRLDGIATAHANRGLVVCADEHRFQVAKHLEASTREWQTIVEPVARNTAPALTLAALHATADGEDPILVVTPADHAIDDVPAFERAVQGAALLARQGKVVTLGIVPTRAETGYGYIETGAALDGAAGHRARALTRFVEKPDRETAETFVASGKYWWNAGIFVVRASVWLNAIDTARQDIARSCQTAWMRASKEGDAWRPDAESLAACPNDSIDYAVMERLADCGIDGAVVPLEAGWNDVGAWDAVWDILPKDDAGNVTRGDVLLANASGTYAHSEDRLIACVGTTDLIVVETADAVLVADRRHAQEVKAIVGGIRKRERTEAAHHRKVQRPWGYYDSIDKGSRYQVKRIVVMPGATLSLQLHYHRSEHWIVVSGTARVTRGDETFMLAENQSTYVPVGVKHRLENPGRVPLEMIEVQCGSYLGEDDIVRFDDRYGRQ
ncbi:mannose-1-phosphate guanylyltransferase/mannose-6-phosphate isomerase [Paraburkholderia sp. LEh10]|uniref:mannose-1-phosphate guanylyltransferase/mannose-6-phosphate isomerase n=1 Tax=Paraburkholderia sp. LEh10 TaxID=2821353 RepID=UPI0039180387